MTKMSTRRYAYTPDYAVAPGVTLQETIDALGMNQRELAVRTGMAPKYADCAGHRVDIMAQRPT